MLFNSLQFALFFLIVYSLYLVLPFKWQNKMLLMASYIFYGFWDWRFLSLIWVSTIIDYFCGIKIQENTVEKKRKIYLIISIFSNLFILGFFKYFDFFSYNLQQLLSLVGLSIKLNYLNVMLPVGISFYTFQTMSYTIDIYRREMKPTHEFFDFALFVAFFPQLVAGPIERAKHLLPQILSPRKITWEKFRLGCYLIFWGLFMKVYVADNLARIVDPIFFKEAPYQGVQVLLSLYAFAFQIFCDFAGYSNIARGLGACMGFDIMVNFNIPYISTNPSEFWTRWHISLSRWLKDYLYIPLGGNKRGKWITYRNLAMTMFLGGLWHGAAWTFVCWGIYQGTILIIFRLLKPHLKFVPRPTTIISRKVFFWFKVFFFFHVTCLGWLIFRANSMTQVWQMLQGLIFNFNIHSRHLVTLSMHILNMTWMVLLVQLWQYKNGDLEIVLKGKSIFRITFYYICLFYLFFYGVGAEKQFIYFQF